MLVEGAVVVTVSVAVAGLPARLTGLEEPKLKVGGSSAPAGLAVRAAAKVTLPVKPSEGVTVMGMVLPVAAPGAMESVLPLNAKLGGVLVTAIWKLLEDGA